MSMRIANEAAQAMNKMRGQNWQGTITQTTKTDYF
jgi:hypothetical protein